MNRQLDQDFVNLINKKFMVLDTIDLFFYDHNFDQLLARLNQNKKSYYRPNEKIVILHFDTEYYLYKECPGISVTNLHIILDYLDIPFSAILLITNHYGLESKLTAARKEFTTEEKNMPTVFCNFQFCLINPSAVKPISINTESIEHSLICLNGQNRSHRSAVVAMFKHKDLLKSNLVSYKNNELN